MVLCIFNFTGLDIVEKFIDFINYSESRNIHLLDFLNVN